MSGTVITFYSYKGGVGRTQALANVGTLLSVWGYRVLCIDWDLEAPGLHRYFNRWLSPAPAVGTDGLVEVVLDHDLEDWKAGVPYRVDPVRGACLMDEGHITPRAEGLVELIIEHGTGQAADWRRCVQKVSFPQETAQGATLDFLAAGRFDAQYVERLQALDWEALYRERHFGEWLEELRTAWKEEYDFILIDSRTGITDLGGICTIQLPDILVLLFTASQQSLDGVLDVARRATGRQGHLPFDRASLPCVPVPTRFESRVELEIAKVWLETFATRLNPLYRTWLAKGVEPRQLLDVLRLPYVPYWSFGEKMPVLDEGVREPESLGYALATLTALLAHELDQTEILVTNRDDFVEAARGLDAVAAANRLVAVGAVAQSGGVAVGRDLVKIAHDLRAHDLGTTGEPTLRSSYLRSLIAHTQDVPLGVIDSSAIAEGDSRVSVEAVYVPLLTNTPEDGRGNSRFRSALAQLNLHSRLVLLGDPGSGKSMVARFLALCMAGEALDLHDVNLHRLISAVPDSAESGERWDHGPLLPVQISLRDFAARSLPAQGDRATAQQLWSFIEKDLAAAGLGEYSPFLRRHLLTQGGLLILDGLDEVPEAEARREQVRQAIEDLAASFAQCRILVTCRTYAYQNQEGRLRGFAQAILAPFDDDQIGQFIHRWYANAAAIGRLRPEDAAGLAARLLRGILASDRLRELAERPLLLALMASLHAWRGSLPEGREELYAAAVELLLNTWEGRRVHRDVHGQPMLEQPGFAEFLKVGRETVRAALEELAYEACGRRPDSLGTADIEEGRLVAKLLQLSQNPEVRPALLVNYLRDRAGLLEPRGVGVYTFPHRVFQEYLAACYLTRESFPDRLADLARADPLRWREVVLLAGAKAVRGATVAVWYLAEALCWREPDDPAAGIEDIWGALIAGELAAESVDLGRVGGANLRKLERLRRWLVRLLGEVQLPAAERCLVGRCLARLGDSRPEVITVDGMTFYQVPAGVFQMGTDVGDPLAHSVELPAHTVEIPYGFRIGRYPVTVAQYREFVESSGYEPEEPACVAGWQNHPAVLVSWQDAIAFCGWLTDRWRATGLLQVSESVTLPSEAEWEKAARGEDERSFPWGAEAATERANFAATGIGSASAVGCFPAGASPFGCEEISGNVWEWTRSLWGHRWEEPDFAYPYHPGDGREDLGASPGTLRILRGGSYINSSRDIRCTSRTGLPPGSRNAGTGFRVVLSPSVGAV